MSAPLSRLAHDRSILTLIAVVAVGQTVLLLLLVMQLQGVRDRFDTHSRYVLSNLQGIEAFIKFTTDGVWFDLEEMVSPSRGAASPTVTVVEFADFQCPACALVADSLQEFVDAHAAEVRLAFKHLPIVDIHPHAELAALGGICVSDTGKFWEYHNRLYAGQIALAQSGYDQLLSVATELDLSIQEFARCIENQETRKRLSHDMRLAQQLGINSTPTFFINGKRVEGANWEFLRAAILFELRGAQAASRPERLQARTAPR